MGWIALRRLRFGDGHIEPGEPVPHEPGRDYDGMLRVGEIADAGAVDALRAERDALKARVAELEKGAPPDSGDDEPLPDGWTETSPGWFEGPDGQKVHGRKALAAATS